MHLVALAQSLGLFLVVCLATAAVLSLAMAALTRMEQVTIPVSNRDRQPRTAHRDTTLRQSVTERVSSPGSCTYRSRGR